MPGRMCQCCAWSGPAEANSDPARKWQCPQSMALAAKALRKKLLLPFGRSSLSLRQGGLHVARGEAAASHLLPKGHATEMEQSRH